MLSHHYALRVRMRPDLNLQFATNLAEELAELPPDSGGTRGGDELRPAGRQGNALRRACCLQRRIAQHVAIDVKLL